ncbi:tetratricopeptide repeat protein 19 homolog, mitochondrial [Ostrinia nubilalis]|uniref:tetratricopeptide repeat protein 19 homolog, mitochondrial n=1 Tax=Ostrinia nubilalis TaxID=29057 RepID=UPI0030826442
MSSRLRFLFRKLYTIRSNFKRIPVTFLRDVSVQPKISVVPVTIGFSLFTWLGFQPKLSAEDELIHTIKHCILFIQRGEYEKAEQLLHISLRQAQQIQHEQGITYIYDVMANLALERAQLDKAKQLFVSVAQRIMQDGATEDDPRMVHISSKLARISHLKKEYSTAQLGYDYCLEKLRTAMQYGADDATKKLLAMTEDWYGRLFLDCQQIEQSLPLLISSLKWMREVSDVDKEHIVIQLNDIGTVCDLLGKADESINYFKEAIELGKDLNMDDMGAMYVNLGRAYLKKNLIAEARKSCGYGWKLGVVSKNNDIKQEAESCLQELKNHS